MIFSLLLDIQHHNLLQPEGDGNEIVLLKQRSHAVMRPSTIKVVKIVPVRGVSVEVQPYSKREAVVEDRPALLRESRLCFS